MIVAGGIYAEKCLYPKWDHIYGSGLRAAIAVSQISPGSILFSYVPKEWRADIEATLCGLRIEGRLEPTERQITFGYLDAFQKFEIPSEQEPRAPSLFVEGDVVLRFGMIEGDAKVMGGRVVYDPQSSDEMFDGNGSHSDMLALVVSETELLALVPENQSLAKHQMSDTRIREAVITLRDQGSAPQVILVKDGLGGLTVFLGDEPEPVPSYAAESYFRIGSGDVIAAAFAHAWGELGMDARAAADYAARCAAYFVEGPRLPLPPPSALNGRVISNVRKEHIRLLGIGDFELQSLVLQTESWIRHLGGTVRHKTFDSRDQLALDDSVDLVLVGSRSTEWELKRVADAAHSPFVVFWPGENRDMAYDLFPGALIASDYATALYHAMRGPAI